MHDYTATIQHQQAFELIAHTNSSFFLTGKAGTGKTTFLRNVQEDVDKNFIILAPTGVAALNAGGETIHSFFRLPLGAIPLGQKRTINKDRATLIQECDTFIIDEVSMVRRDTVDAIDTVLRSVMCTKTPFGGKQMVFVGDMMQLEPIVSTQTDRDILVDSYGDDKAFFFLAKVFERMSLPSIEFRKIFRQEDEEFKRILNEVRLGNVSPASLDRLNSRLTAAPKDEMVVTLSAHKNTASNINSSRLDAIKKPLHTFTGKIEKDFSETNLTTPMELKLKEGAQVMFTRNDPSRRWVNGTIGIVSRLSKDEICVTLKDGKEYEVEKTTWEHNKYRYDRTTKKVEKEVAGSFTQYPLTLAWAITIHKSQGLTFDKMILDLSRGVFSDGQLYVALSRVRSLSGLFLSQPIKSYFARSNKDVLAFSERFNDDAIINKEIKRGRLRFDTMQCHDPDKATSMLKKAAYEEAVEGDYREAVTIVGELLDNLISDEHLYDPKATVPNIKGETTTVWLLKAFFSLYSCKYEDAVSWCDKVIDKRQCEEALYLKARALAKKGKMKEADGVHVDLVKLLGDNTDKKTWFAVGCLNEMIGDPGIDILQALYEKCPDYFPAVEALQRFARKSKKSLDKSDNALVKAFNSDKTGARFAKLYHNADSDQLDEFRTILKNTKF